MPDMMGKMDIAFPHLGIYLKDVPQSITIGSFSIALYGICIAAAMLAGILLAAHIAKKTGWDPNIIWDISIWLIIFAIIGARLYYVIFFWDAYKDNLLQIFNLRAGGLAIYGGIIACVIVVFVYCKVRRVNPFRLLDTAAYTDWSSARLSAGGETSLTGKYLADIRTVCWRCAFPSQWCAAAT